MTTRPLDAHHLRVAVTSELWGTPSWAWLWGQGEGTGKGGGVEGIVLLV